MKYLCVLWISYGMLWAAERRSLTELELRQAKARAELKQQQAAELKELLADQIAELTALRQRLVRSGNFEQATQAAAALVARRKESDFQPQVEPVKRLVEAIVKAKPATVQMMALKPRRLKEAETNEEGRWARIPNELLGASIYDEAVSGTNGVADFKVTRSGQLYLALNYDYQGNGSGGWTEERWMPEDFMAAGWAQVRGMQMVAWGNRTFSIFTRPVEKGEVFRLRCNKYEPPYVILLDGGKAAKQVED